MYYLYKITNLLNDKIYIGQSKNPSARWRRHKSDSKLLKNKSHLGCAIRKYGIDNFRFEIIVQAKSLEDIDYAEVLCIKQYKSSDRKFGYNISEGGNGKRIVSQETRDKIAKINTGKKASIETKHKMSQSMLGKNSGKNNGMFGIRSPNAKLTMKQISKIRKDYESGNVSYLDLSVKYNVSKKTIINIIKLRIYKK